MAKKKPISRETAKACRTLLRNGAVKKYLAKALDMSPHTLDYKLMLDELEQYRARDAQRGKILDFDRKQA